MSNRGALVGEVATFPATVGKPSWSRLTFALNVAMVALLLLVIYLLEHFAPVIYVFLISEDSIVEYATAFSFAFAAWSFGVAGRQSRGLSKAVFTIGAVLAFVIAGEEISWAQRILNIDTPELVSAVNSQRELNIHNAIHLPPHFKEVVVLATMALATLARSFGGVWPRISELPLPPFAILPLAAATLFILIFAPFVKTSEIGEMFLGFMAVIWATNAAAGCRLPASLPLLFRGSRGLAMLAFALTAFISPLLTITFGSDMSSRYNLSASRDYPARHKFEQSDKLFRYILSNPEYIRSNTLSNYRRMKRRAEAYERGQDAPNAFR